MEINTRQMEALLQLQEQQAQLPHNRNNSGSTDFQNILNQQLTGLQQNAGAGPAGNSQAALYSQIMLDNAGQDHTSDPDAAVLQAAFDEASGTLDLWDTYAATLGTSTSDSALRDAYSLLLGIDSRVAQLRANPAVGRSSELDSILGELEVLSATEKFKFNRGDYLM